MEHLLWLKLISLCLTFVKPASPVAVGIQEGFMKSILVDHLIVRGIWVNRTSLSFSSMDVCIISTRS